MGSEGMMSETDLFVRPVSNFNILGSNDIELKPVNSITNGGPIEFFIPGTPEHYTDLSKTRLKVHAKLLKQNPANNAWEDMTAVVNTVGPVNLLLWGLFSQIEAMLNDTQVQAVNNLAPYIAYLETLLNYGTDAKETQLALEMFYKDTKVKSEEIFNASNQGMIRRKNRVNTSQVCEMIGKLHLDICKMNKFLLNNVDVKFKFIRSGMSFPIISREPAPAAGVQPVPPIQYRFLIVDASLYVRKIKLNPDLMLAHAMVLEKTPCIYPINQTVAKYFGIERGNSDTTKENVFLGRIPNRIIIGFVKTSAFNGDLTENPFNFENLDLTYLTVTIGNKNYPDQAFQPDYAAKRYSREYQSLFTALDFYGKNKGNDISYEEYAQGNTLYALDLTPEEQANAEHFSLEKHGSLRITIKFRNPLPYPVTTIVYGEFENQLLITKDRTILYKIE